MTIDYFQKASNKLQHRAIPIKTELFQAINRLTSYQNPKERWNLLCINRRKCQNLKNLSDLYPSKHL